MINKKILQILDANFNRSTEGLRVVEEIARFSLNDERLTKLIKSNRHKIAKIAKQLNASHSRTPQKDFGRKQNFDSHSYKNITELASRNFKRTQEAARVIEEFSKLFSPVIPSQIKKIRFKTYEIEKTLLQKLNNSKLC